MKILHQIAQIEERNIHQLNKKYIMFYFLFQAQNEMIGAAVAEIASQQQLYPQTGNPKYIEKWLIVYLFLLLTFINLINNLKVYLQQKITYFKILTLIFRHVARSENLVGRAKRAGPKSWGALTTCLMFNCSSTF
jgi:hypothetical protein